jgi:heptosyltransferase-2
MARQAQTPLLVLQPMVGIGDMVWHKPWLDEIISRHEMVLMAKPSAQAGAVMAEHPGLSIIPLHRAERGRKGRHDGIIGFFRMVLAMRQAKAGEIWILHRSWRYGAAAWLAGIPRRSGYGLGKQSWFLNEMKGLPASLKGAHPREAVARFTAEMGISPRDTQPSITVSRDEAQAAARLIAANIPAANIPAANIPDAEIGGDDRPLVILGVGAADAERRWSPARFAAMLDHLATNHRGGRFALCGSPAEQPIGQAVLDALSPETPRPMMVFDQPVRSVIALHHEAALYIGNDTSLINIAVAVGTPAIRVFASTLPVLNSPLIETILPDDPARMDIPGSIDDIQADTVAAMASHKLDRLT